MANGPVEVHFHETDGAIRFSRPEMVQEFRRVVHDWPCAEGAGSVLPFADVSKDGVKWDVRILGPDPRQKTYDVVNGICDLIVELNWSRLRQKTELLCLHAAGVEMGEALLVLPSGRRAGKSTLTAELARRGHRVFSDDILALQLDANGVAIGLATGISPRLRVPLPAEATYRFLDWVNTDPGPSNRQYKYLTNAPVAEFNASKPLGAIVTLDRVDEDVEPAFSEIDPKVVLPVLIHQNFGRFAHSGRTLAALSAVAHGLPCLKLTYGNFERAADFLEALIAEGLLESGAKVSVNHRAVPDFDADIAPFDVEKRYRQRAGFHYVEANGEAFIADADGIGIFGMGPGMLPIWRLLEEPMSVSEIVAVMKEVFPETSRETLNNDASAALRQLNDAGLIEMVRDCEPEK